MKNTIVEMLSAFSRITLEIVTGLQSTVRRNVAIGGDVECPVKAVIGGTLFRCGDGALFNTLWKIGKSWGHTSLRSCISDRSERTTRSLYFPSLFTAPFDHGQ